MFPKRCPQVVYLHATCSLSHTHHPWLFTQSKRIAYHHQPIISQFSFRIGQIASLGEGEEKVGPHLDIQLHDPNIDQCMINNRFCLKPFLFPTHILRKIKTTSPNKRKNRNRLFCVRCPYVNSPNQSELRLCCGRRPYLLKTK